MIMVEGIDALMEQTLVWVNRWFRQPRFDQADVDKRLATVLTDRRNSMEDPRDGRPGAGRFRRAGPAERVPVPAQQRRAGAAQADELRRLLAAFPDHAHKTLYFGPRRWPRPRARGAGQAHRPVAPRLRSMRYARPSAPRSSCWIAIWPRPQLSLTFCHRPPAAGMTWADRWRSATTRWGHALVAVPGDPRGPRPGLSVDVGHRLGARPADDTALIGYLATQPDKTAEALGRLLEIVGRPPCATIGWP